MSNEYKDWQQDMLDSMSTTQQENYRLSMRYPVIIPNDIWDGKKFKDGFDYSYTLLDDIPYGWRKAFGEQWASEVQDIVNRQPQDSQPIRILQLKEKFGRFTQYFSRHVSDLVDIVEKYENLSLRTCIECGEPATRMSTGWIAPYCDTCIGKLDSVPIQDYLKEVES